MKSAISPFPKSPFVSVYALRTKSSRVPSLFKRRSSFSTFSMWVNFLAYSSALLSTNKILFSSSFPENCFLASSSSLRKSASFLAAICVKTRNKALLFLSTLTFSINWLNCVDSNDCPMTGFKKMTASAFSIY